MKKLLNIKLREITAIVFIILFAMVAVINIKTVYGDSKNNAVSIVFTSDLHSHLTKFKTRLEDRHEVEVGGFSRLNSFIKDIRNEDADILLVDAGDLISGTLYQTLIDTDAVELSMLSEMGYDAITLGNHEFDFGAESLAKMYSIVKNKYEKRPSVVLCNIDLSNDSEYTKKLATGLNEYGIKDYIITEKNGIKIAITGVIGYDAIDCIIAEGLKFHDPVESVKSTVEKIKSTENPDLIVCISHSGTGTSLGKTEDEQLAKAVPDIDIIVSGHTHTVLNGYIKVGETSIVSCGVYGVNTGVAKLQRKENGRWNIYQYDIKLMDDSVEEDEESLEKLNDYIYKIDENILSPYDLKYDEVLAKNDNIIFETSDEYYENHSEIRLGNLLSDAYRYSVGRYGDIASPVDIAIIPSGTIRDSIYTGDINVSDVFSVLSMGSGKDDKNGYPLAEAYLSGEEIMRLAEIDATFSDYNYNYRIHPSGISYKFNPHRLYFNRVSELWISSSFLEDSVSTFDKKRLYHLVTDYYTMTVLNDIENVSHGIIKATIKDVNGNPVSSVDDCIIYDKDGNELKCFIALAKYLKSFPAGNNGVSIIPEYYNAYHSRKIIDTSYSLNELLNNLSWKIYAAICIFILIIVLIFIIIKFIKRKNSKKKALYY